VEREEERGEKRSDSEADDQVGEIGFDRKKRV
jgi:hypothetical protein